MSSASTGNAAAVLSSCPHPDSFVPNLLRELRAAVEAFKTENGSVKSMIAVQKAFKSAGCALERAAPAPGQHVFLAGERVMLQDLKQRSDLNGCTAVVRTEADAIEGDGRVEVCLGTGSKKEALRVRPCNLRLEWHAAADEHVACVGCCVLVRSLDSAARGRVCQVIAFDREHEIVTVLAAADECGRAADVTCRVGKHEVVPAAYCGVAKELHACAMKVILKAVGASATPAVTQVLNAVESSCSFNIRCARDNEAARACVSVLNMLHTGGRSGLSPKDSEERRTWTGDFLCCCCNRLDPLFRRYGFFDCACSILELCKQIVVDWDGKDSLQVAGMLHNIAALHDQRDRLAEAEAALQAALEINEARLGRDTLQVADSLICLAMLREKQYRLTDAEPIYMEVLRIREAKLGPESLPVAATMSNLASLTWSLGRFAEADVMFKEVLRVYELKCGHESTEVADTLNNIACMYQKMERNDEARAILDEALRIKLLKYGRESLNVADTLNNLAGLNMKQGLLVEAEELYREALRIKQLKFGYESSKVASMLNSVAVVLRNQERLDEAAALEAYRIQVMKEGKESVDVARTLNNLAVLHERMQRLSEAEAAFIEALRIMKMRLGAESLEVAGLTNNLATFYERHDRLAEAEELYKEALRINESKLGSESSSAAGARSSLADLHPPPLSDIDAA